MSAMIRKYGGKYTMWLLIAVIYMLPLFLVHGAAVDYFLKIEGVPGESTDARHKDWIIIESMSQGYSRPVSGSGSNRVVGPLEKQDFVVTKWIDKSSPILMLSTCGGTVFPKVEIALVNRASTNKETTLKYTLSDCIVSSFSTGPSGGSSGEPLPLEQFSLNFAKIEVSYKEQDIASGEITNAVTVSCDSEPDGTL